MTPSNDLSDPILRTRNQIYQIKLQIEEEADPKEKRRLQYQLKELLTVL